MRVPRVLHPEEDCRCERPAVIREDGGGPADWYCARCGLPPSEAHRPPAELDALLHRVRGLTTYAGFVAELGEPRRVQSRDQLREERARLLRARGDRPGRALPGPNAVRAAWWDVSERLQLWLYEHDDGSVEHHIGIYAQGRRTIS